MSDDAPDLDAVCRDAFGEAISVAMEGAEPVEGPLDGLVEKVKEDPGAAFAPEVLEALLALKDSDRAAYENLRSRLKRAGCRVTALDDAIREENGDDGRGPTQADILIDLAAAAVLFHTSDGTAYADFDVNGHRETWPVRNKGFKRWLARQFFERTDGAPSSEAMQSALNVIEAQSHFDGTEEQIFVRIGGLGGRIYLDLADPEWRAIEIDGEGWRVVDTPPVRFRRSAGVKALPVPEPGGTVDALRPFLNVGTEEDFVLAVAWMLATLRDRGPYPALVLAGEQGSAKSTFLAIMRELLDPNAAPLRALPREDRDLFIAATNGHLLAFDNVSGLAPWISDTLCRLATGGGFTTRQLYTDGDEVIFDAMRPVALNGIEDIVTRPDLADRAVFLTLDPIPEDKRRPEAELWAKFHAARPRILGALLDAVVEGLKNLPTTKLPKLPRMADFALWASACETAAWPAGTFWEAYADNVEGAVDSVIEGDPVANAVRELMLARTVWTGTAAALLAVLTEAVGERTARTKTWPATPRMLGGRLRRTATFLRKAGFAVTFDKDKTAKRERTITIEYAAKPSFSEQTEGVHSSSKPSRQSSGQEKPNGSNGLASDGRRMQNGASDGSTVQDGPTVQKPSSGKPLNTKGLDGMDGMDGSAPTQSAPEKTKAGWSGKL